MNLASSPILSIVTFLPLVGALFIAGLSREAVQNIRFAAPDGSTARFRDLCAALEITEVLSHRPVNASQGQRQRAGQQQRLSGGDSTGQAVPGAPAQGQVAQDGQAQAEGSPLQAGQGPPGEGRAEAPAQEVPQASQACLPLAGQPAVDPGRPA